MNLKEWLEKTKKRLPNRYKRKAEGNVTELRPMYNQEKKAEQREKQKRGKDPLNQPAKDYKYLEQRDTATGAKRGHWAKDQGVSEAGAFVRDANRQHENSDFTRPHDMDRAKRAHQETLRQLKAQPKPNLTKEEVSFNKGGQWSLDKRCWEGYEPTPGKKAYSEDSCRPIKKDTKKSDATHIAGELDWSDLYKSSEEQNYSHEPSALWAAQDLGGKAGGVDPLNKAKPVNDTGEVPRAPSNDEITSYILKGADAQGVGQWRDEDHLHKEIISQEQAEQLQKDWDNGIDAFYKAAQAPVVSKEEQKLEWGDGGSFNDTLTEEERLKRNMYTGD